MKKSLVIFFGLIFLSLPLIYPFFQAGYFSTHDGEWAIVRLAEMHREIREGQIPPRWAGYLNHGYGYPLFLFTYPFPYYVAEAFHLIGLGLVDAVKEVFILSVLGSAVAMFLFARSEWGEVGGIAAAALYLYAPYRLTNLFVRGSIGESLAFIFFPALFYLFKRLIRYKKIKDVVVTAITLGAFILTHNVTVVLFLPILGIWIVYLLLASRQNLRVTQLVLLTIFFGLAISAYFWVPAVAEKKFIVLSQTPLTNRKEHYLSLGDFLIPEIKSYNTPKSIKLGNVHLLGLVMTGVLLVILGKKQHPQIKLQLFFVVITVVSTLMVFPISDVAWKMPLLREIDFPWRILSIVTFLASFTIAGLSIRQPGKILLCIIAGVAVITYVDLKPSPVRSYKDDQYYATNDATTTSADELMPIWVYRKPTNRPAESDTVKLTPNTGGIFESPNISNYYNVKEQSTKTEFSIDSSTPVLVELSTVYFPGWRATVDGKEEVITSTSLGGLISFPVAKGVHQISVQFKRTPVRAIADTLTIIGFVCLAGLWIHSRKSFRTY